MPEPRDDSVAYDTLRGDLIGLLMEHRAQGRFTHAVEGTDRARSLFLADLTRSIADILVTAYPTANANVYTAVLAEARSMVRSVLQHDLPPITTCN
jgi:hypothetical protein